MKNKIGMHDVIKWIEEVGNENTLRELRTLVDARLINLKYFEETF